MCDDLYSFWNPHTINLNLKVKYSKHNVLKDRKIINDIVYNEKTPAVAKFKDYLIIDDLNEFFKQFYDTKEIVYRLPKIYEFYHKFSTVFPNYYPLEQSKYMFKNIERKQKAINEQQEFEDRQQLKKRIAAGQSQLGDVS